MKVPDYQEVHPALIYLQDIENTWYIWPCVFLFLLLTIYCLLCIKYPSFRIPFKKCCKFKKKTVEIELTERGDCRAEEQANPLMEATSEEIASLKMKVINLGFIQQIRCTKTEELTGWTGSQWRNMKTNTLIHNIKDPPTYMQNLLIPYSVECEIQDGRYPMLSIKGFPNTYWDKQKGKWMMIEKGQNLYLPDYTRSPPNNQLLNMLDLAKAEARTRAARS